MRFTYLLIFVSSLRVDYALSEPRLPYALLRYAVGISLAMLSPLNISIINIVNIFLLRLPSFAQVAHNS